MPVDPQRWYRRHPLVRPFIVHRDLPEVPPPLEAVQVDTMVSATAYDPRIAATLNDDAQRVYQYACQRMSVAEVSAYAGLPLGSTRVILTSLADDKAITIQPTDTSRDAKVMLLERVLDGLQRL